jgi:hypothetical protein
MPQDRPPRREDIIQAFRPVSPLLREVIAHARKQTTTEAIKAAFPVVERESHQFRIAGNVRWMLVADGLVDRERRMPKGFSVESTDEQHNAGQYIFRFPRGVYMVKRKPHKEGEEGTYLQERLEEILEETPFADGIDIKADLKVVLSVPANRMAKLIATHPTFERSMVIPIDDLDHEPPVALPPRPEATEAKPRGVRSKLRPEEAEGGDTDTDQQP